MQIGVTDENKLAPFTDLSWNCNRGTYIHLISKESFYKSEK